MAAAARESSILDDIDIYLNAACSQLEHKLRVDPDGFCNSVVSWVPEGSTRAFDEDAANKFLDCAAEGGLIRDVIGFCEFPYTHGRTLTGPDAEIEREYWFEVNTDDPRIHGPDGLVILHVHYADKWQLRRRDRVRSCITQVNIRHTTKWQVDASQRKSVDLDRWKESRGRCIKRFLGGWKWQENPEVAPGLHSLLSRAEQCTRWVRGKTAVEFESTAKRRALIIANSDYSHFDLLPNPKHDGLRLSAVLEKMAWKVQLKVDQTVDEMRNVVSDYEAKDEEVCMFAFFGHGISVNGNLYLAGKDSRPSFHEFDVKFRCMGVDFVQEHFGRKRFGEHPTIFVLDCCRQTPTATAAVAAGGATESVAASAQSVADRFKNLCTIYSTSSGDVADDGDPGHGSAFTRAFVNEIKKGGELQSIVMRTNAALEQAGIQQLAPLEWTPTKPCFFEPLSPAAAPLSESLHGGVFSEASTTQQVSSAAEQQTLPPQASGSIQNGVPVSPLPFTYASGSKDHHSGHFNRFAKSWEGYDSDRKAVFHCTGEWGGMNGCARQIIESKPAILHVDAVPTHSSGGMWFKDGSEIVDYDQLRDILKCVREDGAPVHLLVLMVSRSADDERAVQLNEFAHCVLAVRGEVSEEAITHMEMIYENLRSGRSIKRCMTELSGISRSHNLVLLGPSQHGSSLKFSVCPKDYEVMVKMLEAQPFSDTFYSEADTASEGEDNAPQSREDSAAVFLYNPGGTGSSCYGDVQRIFDDLFHRKSDHPPRLSMCCLLLVFAVGNPGLSGFDSCNSPQHWHRWLETCNKEAAAAATAAAAGGRQVSEALILNGFEAAASASGVTEGRKQHSRAITVIDNAVRKAIQQDWEMLASNFLRFWECEVLKEWTSNEESSEVFLKRANKFLLSLVVDGSPQDGICGVRILQRVVPMRSYGAFLVMNQFAANLLFESLRIESFVRVTVSHTVQTVDRDLGGFVAAVSSYGQVFRLDDAAVSRRGKHSVLVSGLRCLAAMSEKEIGDVWELSVTSPPTFFPPPASAWLCAQRVQDGQQQLEAYLQWSLSRTGCAVDGATGELVDVRSQCTVLQAAQTDSFWELCDSAESNAVQRDQICPISRRLMEDPVKLVGDGKLRSGHCYERAALEKEMARQEAAREMTGTRCRSPMSRESFETWEIIADPAKQSEIQEYLVEVQKRLRHQEQRIEGEEEVQLFLHRQGYAATTAQSWSSEATPLLLSQEAVLQACEQQDSVCVVGAPATGKTTVMLRLATECAETAMQKKGLRVPLYIRASDVGQVIAACAPDTDRDFDVIKFYILHSASLTGFRSILLQLDGAGLLLVLIDGLDESQQYRACIESSLDARLGGSSHFGQAVGCVVSTRTSSYVDSRIHLRLRKFLRFDVQPLDEAAAREIVSKRISEAEQQMEFWSGLEVASRGSPEIRSSPFLLCLAISSFLKLRSIPAKRWELHKLLIEGMVRRCLTENQGEAETEDGLQFMGCIAYCSHMTKSRDFVFDDGFMTALAVRWSLLKSTSALGNDMAIVRALKSAFVDTRLCGILSCCGSDPKDDETDRAFRFCHLTHQEFLAAHHVVSCSRAPAQIYDELFQGGGLELWNREVCLFCACLVSEEAFEVLCKHIVDGEDGSVAMCETVYDLLNERGQSKTVTSMLVEKYARTCNVDDLVNALCHPSSELRARVITELRRFSHGTELSRVLSKLINVLFGSGSHVGKCAAILSLGQLCDETLGEGHLLRSVVDSLLVSQSDHLLHKVTWRALGTVVEANGSSSSGCNAVMAYLMEIIVQPDNLLVVALSDLHLTPGSLVRTFAEKQFREPSWESSVLQYITVISDAECSFGTVDECVTASLQLTRNLLVGWSNEKVTCLDTALKLLCRCRLWIEGSPDSPDLELVHLGVKALREVSEPHHLATKRLLITFHSLLGHRLLPSDVQSRVPASIPSSLPSCTWQCDSCGRYGCASAESEAAHCAKGNHREYRWVGWQGLKSANPAVVKHHLCCLCAIRLSSSAGTTSATGLVSTRRVVLCNSCERLNEVECAVLPPAAGFPDEITVEWCRSCLKQILSSLQGDPVEAQKLADTPVPRIQNACSDTAVTLSTLEEWETNFIQDEPQPSGLGLSPSRALQEIVFLDLPLDVLPVETAVREQLQGFFNLQFSMEGRVLDIGGMQWAMFLTEALCLRTVGRFLFSSVLQHIERTVRAGPGSAESTLQPLKDALQSLSASCHFSDDRNLLLEVRLLEKEIRVGRRCNTSSLWTGPFHRFSPLQRLDAEIDHEQLSVAEGDGSSNQRGSGFDFQFPIDLLDDMIAQHESLQVPLHELVSQIDSIVPEHHQQLVRAVVEQLEPDPVGPTR